MGTNFYWRADSPRCETCNQRLPDHGLPPRLHVGKRSAGWKFHVHIHPEQGIRSWADWKDRLTETSGLLRDEYGRTINVEAFIRDVEDLQARTDTRHGDLYQGSVDDQGYAITASDFT